MTAPTGVFALIYIAVMRQRGWRGCSEVTDAGYECLITACGALQAGIHDRMFDRGPVVCCVPQEGHKSEQTAGALCCRVMENVSFGN